MQPFAFVRNTLVVSVVLCSRMPLTAGRKWAVAGGNASAAVLASPNVTELQAAAALVCLLHASPDVNVACYGPSGRCLSASVYLPHALGGGSDPSCWYSQLCRYGATLLQEGEFLTVSDPSCRGKRNLTCTIRGLVYQDAPLPRESCTPPFTQYPFGCMYDSSFTGNYCQTRDYCESLGAGLASPMTSQDVLDMRKYFAIKIPSMPLFWLGLHKVDGVWRWPANQRDAGQKAGTGDWTGAEPNNFPALAGMMWNAGGYYGVGDSYASSGGGRALCHVWFPH